MSFSIRTVEPKDALGLTELYHKTWLATYPNDTEGITCDDIEARFKDVYTNEYQTKHASKLANVSKNECYLVAEEDGAIIGSARMVRENDYNQLRTIYVLPEHQGKGVGRALWNGVYRFADPTKKTIVHVAIYNKQAISFYEGIGFVQTGKIFTEERLRLPSGALFRETELILEARQ